MAFLRVIADVHQKYDAYLSLLEGCEYSIQLGDLGFDYSYLQDKLAWGRDVFFPGNHDNYDKESNNFWQKQNFALGNFGLHYISDWKPIFYLRGAWSIDQRYRVNGIDWWPDEELSHDQLRKAVYQYKLAKPDILLCHEAPLQLVRYVTNPDFARRFGFAEPVIQTRTNQALQYMFDIHKPKFLIHGHYHSYHRINIHGCECISLDMVRGNSDNQLAYFDFDEMSQEIT